MATILFLLVHVNQLSVLFYDLSTIMIKERH